MHNLHGAGNNVYRNNVYRLAAVSYFAITFSIRTLKRNTLIANKIELNDGKPLYLSSLMFGSLSFF